MPDYEKIKNICLETGRISSKVLDEFLIHYVADRENLEREINQRMSRYRQVLRKLPGNTVDLFKSQYIAHRIFKKNGLIGKYLNHTVLKRLGNQERSYLENQAGQLWRFSFSMIENKPAEEFFEMTDVFTGQHYLLYSPSMNRTLREVPILLWFNLIGYNGACWESFGPIAPYRGFEPDDIFFYATELDPRIETPGDLIESVESNPIPYMMLLAGSNYPLIFHKDHQMVQLMGWHEMDSFDTSGLEKKFRIEYAGGIYRLSLKRWHEYPHFSIAYYDEEEKLLALSSLTDRGYGKLVEALKGAGIDVAPEADVRVNQGMLNTVAEVLGKKIRLNEYEDRFPKDVPEKNKEVTDKLNELLAIIIPDINAGREPDIEAAAKQVGVDLQTARDLLAHVRKSLDGMTGKGGG